MVTRRHLLSLLTLAALLVGPFALAPRAARGQSFDFTYTVDKLTDDSPPASGPYCTATPGDCSLRQALTLARAQADTATKLINFATGFVGTITITNPSGVLPALDSKITIQGRVVLGVPQVEIVGSGSNRSVGFQIAGNDNTISSLVIYGFDDAVTGTAGGSGISISGDNNKIFNNYIGLKIDGTTPTPNIRGIRINPGADNNIIGYDQALGGLANVISGNTGVGIDVADANRNIIRGNYIGLRPTGSGAETRGNGSYGIQISSNTGTAEANVVGGASELEANIIGGNSGAGLLIRGSSTLSTTVQGNYIGAYVSNIDLGNAGDGILIEAGAKATTLGGGVSVPLLVSDNAGYGIHIRNSGTDDTAIGSYTLVGLSFAENAALANGLDGIRIADSAKNTRIEGSQVRIAGNTGVGLRVTDLGTDGTRLIGASVGIVPSPTVANTSLQVANNGGGVLFENGASQATISGNTVSGNAQFGIRLSEVLTVTVQGNYVGLNLARSGVFANSGPGLDVYSSTNTLVGGGSAALGNFIAGNGGPAIHIRGSGSVSTTVDANTIGLRRAASTRYTDPAANAGPGVLVENGPQRTLIGGVGNLIGAEANTTANDFPGVQISATATATVTLVTISGNTIGLAPDGANPPIARPNGDGVALVGPGLRNVDVLSNTIRFNTADAVRVSDAMTVTVRNNLALSNSGGRGVFVSAGAFDVEISANTIRANAGEAVRVEGTTTRRVTIQNNKMAANGGAIRLEGTTLYAGTPPDTATPGPNHDIDPPFDLRVTQSGLVTGYVYSDTNLVKRENLITPVSACISCTIELFRPDPTLAAPDGQGWERLELEGGATAAPNAQGFFEAQLVGALPNQLLLVATDGFGNSSQFATFAVRPDLTITPLSPASAAQSAAPGQTVTYTLRLENTGTIDLNNLTLSSGGTLPRWSVQRQPSGVFNLPARATRTITVSLRLPTGSDPSVRVPITDTTTITVSSPGLITKTQQLVTTVLEQPVLRLSPLTNTGLGKPAERISYNHRLFNDGNITVTVRLETRTIDPADSGRIWATTLSTDTVTLGPGQSRDITVNVTVPNGAQETDGQGNPVVATTLITGTAQGVAIPPVTATDTTRVRLNPAAEMFQDEVQNGAAGRQVTFFHTINNLSNGVATFKLNATTNFESQVQLSSDTPGVTINPSTNTFTLDSVLQPPLRTNTLRLKVVVTLNDRLLPGDVEVINIFLTDANGASIGGAAVVDRVNITAGLVQPRLWLPALFNQTTAAP